MKIVCLNVWGSRIHEPLMDFLKNHQEVDIFCLQEVYHEAHGKDTIWTNGTNFNCLNDLQSILPDHKAIYHPHLEDWWGLAMFIKKGVDIKDVGEEYVHKHKRHDLENEKLGHTAKNLQYLHTTLNDKPFTVINFHGLWNGQGKDDTEDRINQSKKVIEFLKKLNNDYVICGDFNLLPETESLKMLERELDAKNLIKEYGITSTRTSFYTKENKYADYVFISSGVPVKEFKVMPEEVSDHAALYLEI